MFGNIRDLLEKMISPDKDFRFMALNDMIVQLQNNSIKLDDDSERRLILSLTQLLEDKNGEVQNLAVKCLCLTVHKAKTYRVEEIVEDLCGKMMSDKERCRDISNTVLKTVIFQFSPSRAELAKNICDCIVSHLIMALQTENVTIQLEALEMLVELLNKFGKTIQGESMESILRVLLPKFVSARQAVRKRSMLACSILVRFSTAPIYKSVIDHVYKGLTINSTMTTRITFLQSISGICRQSGGKFGQHIELFVPLIVDAEEENDEVQYNRLQTLQTFVEHCPKEIAAHIGEIMKLCLEALGYDPNYYDHADEEDAGLDEENYDEGDDESWKVRRSAARCLETIIRTRHEMTSQLYEILSAVLITHFKEREENVKCEIMQAYIALLKQTKSYTEEEGPITLLRHQLPHLIKSVCAQIEGKDVKTRQKCFELLQVLIEVIPGALTEHIEEIVAAIKYTLENQASLKLEVLIFIRAILYSHPPTAFYSHVNELLPLALTGVNDSFHKTATQALIVVREMVNMMRPKTGDFHYATFLQAIYDCTFPKLSSQEIDVRHEAILTMAAIIGTFGDSLREKVAICEPIFVDRLKNEITRLTTIKALMIIVKSPLCIELSMINEILPVLALFLRLNHRTLKLNSLRLIDLLVKNHYDRIDVGQLRSVTEYLPNLLDETDITVAHSTLVLLESLTQFHSSIISKDILPRLLDLLKSPLLQGNVLTVTLQFFRSLTRCNLPGLCCNDLLQLLLGTIRNVEETLHNKQAFYSTAKCAAAIVHTCGPDQVTSIVEKLIEYVELEKRDSQHIFFLLFLGEIGRETALTNNSVIRNAILNAFDFESDDVKFIASYALGCLSISNLDENLPFILNKIQDNPGQRYFLLHCLKEIIVESSDRIGPFVHEMWKPLIEYGESEEEVTRSVAAECLGKLALNDPATLLPELENRLKHSSPFARATVLTAFKFASIDQTSSIDLLLRNHIEQFLQRLKDEDLNVRRAALVLFNSTAHNKPSLIRDLLEDVLPDLYKETQINITLVHEVQIGPFKHTADEGLDIRKVAFECMCTLMEFCLDKIDIFKFIDHLENGLKDHHDIKMLAHLMVERLAKLRPMEVLQVMEQVVDPLRATCATKVKTNELHQEHERWEELKRSAVRAVAALYRIPDSDCNLALNDLVAFIQGSPDLFKMYELYALNNR